MNTAQLTTVLVTKEILLKKVRETQPDLQNAVNRELNRLMELAKNLSRFKAKQVEVVAQSYFQEGVYSDSISSRQSSNYREDHMMKK